MRYMVTYTVICLHITYIYIFVKGSFGGILPDYGNVFRGVSGWGRSGAIGTCSGSSRTALPTSWGRVQVFPPAPWRALLILGLSILAAMRPKSRHNRNAWDSSLQCRALRLSRGCALESRRTRLSSFPRNRRCPRPCLVSRLLRRPLFLGKRLASFKLPCPISAPQWSGVLNLAQQNLDHSTFLIYCMLSIGRWTWLAWSRHMPIHGRNCQLGTPPWRWWRWSTCILRSSAAACDSVC